MELPIWQLGTNPQLICIFEMYAKYFHAMLSFTDRCVRASLDACTCHVRVSINIYLQRLPIGLYEADCYVLPCGILHELHTLPEPEKQQSTGESSKMGDEILAQHLRQESWAAST